MVSVGTWRAGYLSSPNSIATADTCCCMFDNPTARLGKVRSLADIRTRMHQFEFAHGGGNDVTDMGLEMAYAQGLDDAVAVLVEEQGRAGRVMDFDAAVNAPAMIARIRALKISHE